MYLTQTVTASLDKGLAPKSNVVEIDLAEFGDSAYLSGSQKFPGRTKINVAGFSHTSTKTFPSRSASRGAAILPKIPSNVQQF